MSEFVLVVGKKKKNKNYCREGKFKNSVGSTFHRAIGAISVLSPEEICTKVNHLKDELILSEFYKSFVEVLHKVTDTEVIREILCLGLGSFSVCVTARYQLAFLLAIRDHLNSVIQIYDPVFNVSEVRCLEISGCNVLSVNKEGKYKIESKTLVLLPHCPKQLINNFLWCNWGKGLSNCIIVGNSFSDIIDSNSTKFLKDNLSFIYNIYSEVEEIKLENSFRYKDIFNNLSMHMFPKYKINNISDEIWKLDSEPVYKDNELEFITHKN